MLNTYCCVPLCVGTEMAESYYNTGLTKIFESLSTTVKELYLTHGVEEGSISAMKFHREYISPNIPVLIKGAIRDWPALGKWSPKYFQDILGKKEINVTVTPNGYADAVATRYFLNSNNQEEATEYFVCPEERRMTMEDFIDILLKQKQCDGVFYVQEQNSNLTKRFPELIGEVPAEISWASEAFDTAPDAVNLWIGDKSATTSMHKDPYENVYCVVYGHKDFILHPPTDRPWIPYKKYPVGTYQETQPGHFEIIPKEDDSRIPWIPVDPLIPDLITYPLYKNATPIRIRVEEGDALYLPSLWFHHVRQSHGCIAVNYWYDMKYDIKYAYYRFIEDLIENTAE